MMNQRKGKGKESDSMMHVQMCHVEHREGSFS